MMKASKKILQKIEAGDFPANEMLETEVRRRRRKQSFSYALRSTIYTLVTVAAVSVLVAVLLLPVLEIFGESMGPTLNKGDFVVSVKGSSLDTGDVCAFYYNGQILVKRVIAKAGDWVDIKEDGTVYVNENKLDEPYVSELAFGECDIELPFQVPESRIFVMGDHRETSIDSRNTSVGCVAEEQIVGRIVLRVWPLNAFGIVE